MRNPGRRSGDRGVTRRAMARCLVFVTVAAGPSLAAAEPAATSCPMTVLATARVQSVLDGRTFALADGREVRLSGIEIPFDSGAAGEPGPGTRARAALARLIGENEVVLKHLASQPRVGSDRYSRLMVHAYVQTATGEISLARALVAEGHAFVAAAGTGACGRDLGRDLMAAERAARAAKLGLWGDPRYEIKRAENPAEVLAVRGRYTLVEGKVLSVRESGGTIYINFGRRWTEDFTVTIAKRNERAFADAGLAPLRLQGRRVQVRGVVEERGGPWIEALRPEQIEVVGY